MPHDSDGLWPHDPEALDDNRTVDDLDIPDNVLSDEDDTAENELDEDEWGDDADNRLVALDGDDDDEADDRAR
ncbi:hypothetical protein [Cryobacterium sp. PAMC25264]|uniref:hypothetical protein n=1 Tax=Cryobacterium sp. PAMC25264 TaxID=2861288 RepID=UPI001C6366F4|nr:hypothetical protein [Cryobacterium sp. PAMC25264]QYF72594.1 hypothetical protein KY500_12265 [Cryobacterium sp. PAMC25264]